MEFTGWVNAVTLSLQLVQLQALGWGWTGLKSSVELLESPLKLFPHFPPPSACIPGEHLNIFPGLQNPAHSFIHSTNICLVLTMGQDFPSGTTH